MKIKAITWNEEKNIYEVSTKVEITDEEFKTLMDEIFNNNEGD